MKKICSLFILLIVARQAFSQFKTSDLSVSLSYPMPTGNNFVNQPYGDAEGYKGIIDVGADYTILKAGDLDFGLLLNASFLQYHPADLSLAGFSPKAKIGYTIGLKKLAVQPQLALGYVNFRFSGRNPDGSVFDEHVGGISGKASTKLIFNAKNRLSPFFLVGYEFDRIGKLTPQSRNVSYNRNLQFFTLGAGARWNWGI